MDRTGCIVRRWSGRIRTSDETSFVAQLEGNRLHDYSATVGNLCAEILMRRLDDGSTEVTALSWWRSREAAKAFAGDRLELARYYPGGAEFLLERPVEVEHHTVVTSAAGYDPALGRNDVNY
ncbi:MAG TPA: hypothetical protein VGU01_05300 [Sphingomicrobium sp.]|nr:hypothetical protein [Sphingomicrobium sp.]